MATPDFILGLRESIGHAPLWLSGVTAVVVRDAEVLLVRRVDTGHWSSVAGVIDPGEEPAEAAARKTVTALFCDLGGSTGFGERVDAESARAVIGRYHALLQKVVDAHDGSVAKFIGDGMLAFFGIPEVAEDDAARAVAAAA